jgi:hypothetical protein
MTPLTEFSTTVRVFRFTLSVVASTLTVVPPQHYQKNLCIIEYAQRRLMYSSVPQGTVSEWAGKFFIFN